MTGLEKILAEISGEAQAARQAALDEARQQAEAILQESARRTEAECEKLCAQGKKSCEDMISQARAGAELQRRRVLLETRQRLIGETLRAAGNAILDMPPQEYFQALIRIASLYAHTGEGVAHLSRRDLDRLPPDFEKQLNQALPEGCRLTISAEPRSMYGGMVLVYGGVEENCSLRALFGLRSENLLNLADEVMFGPRT